MKINRIEHSRSSVAKNNQPKRIHFGLNPKEAAKTITAGLKKKGLTADTDIIKAANDYLQQTGANPVERLIVNLRLAKLLKKEK